MKPKTKEQKKIAELSEQLPDISPKQKEWIKPKFKKLYTKYYRKFLCLECGHREPSMTPILAEETCPNCGNKVEYVEEPQTRILTMNLIQKYKGYQLVRIFYVYKRHYKKRKSDYQFLEAIQHWISPEGKLSTLSLYSRSTWYIDQWTGTDLEFRAKGYQWQQRMLLSGEHTYPYQQIIPELRLRGYKKTVYPKHYHLFFAALIKYPRLETLLKAGQFDLLFRLYNDTIPLNRYWPSIKIAIRNNYYIDEPNLWFDYLDFLEYFNKDLRNAHYVCPENLRDAHDKYLRRKARKEAEVEIQERINNIKAINKKYLKNKKDYLDIEIKVDNLTIKPLQDAEDFLYEGKMMDHCVFTGKYYERDTLVLSARNNNNIPVQTIELNPETLEIKQIYGFHNQKDQYTPIVEQAINNNKKLFAT